LEEGESPESLEKGVRKQLISWFGQEYDKLEHLKTMKIERALPDQSPPWLDMPRKAIKIDDAGRTLYVCGDHRDNASINGAMVSGRRAAEQILKDLKVTVSLA
jgi:predicted NAD/FAD-dependent oxidoreductase